MSKNYTVMELEAIKHLCKCVNSVASLPADLIADTNVATNTTYSSYKIDAEMSALENDIQRYVDTALAGLNKLSKEVIDDKALVVKENVLYLYKDPTDMNNDYMQMMLINGVAVELGSTTCDFSSVYSKDEANDKFALKINLDTLTTSFNNLVTSVDKKIDKDKIVTVLDDTVTDDEVPSARLVYEELDKKIKIEGDNVVKKDDIVTVLDDTVTDEQIPSAKAVYDVWGEWSVISPIKEGQVRNSNGGGVSYYKQIKDMVIVTCSNVSRLIYTWNIGAKINEGGALPKPIIKIPVSIMSSNGEFYLAELDTDGYIKVKNREIPQTETGNIYYYSFNYITYEL